MLQYNADKMKKNARFFFIQTITFPFAEFKTRAHCIYQHHFHDHSNCDIKWCKYLQYQSTQEWPVKDEDLPIELQPGKQFYRCPKKSWQLFGRMNEALAPYLTEEALKQMWHKSSTQKNEALNKSSSKMAPKDKFLGNTCTLHNCLRMVVIQDSVGYQAGMQRLLDELGIVFNVVLAEWCHWKDNTMQWKRKHSAKKQSKQSIRQSTKLEWLRGWSQRQEIGPLESSMDCAWIS